MCTELYQCRQSINKKTLISFLMFVMLIVMSSVKKYIKSGTFFETHLDTDQRKRRRTTFSNSQLLELEREFRNGNYLSPHRLGEISKKLSLGSTQIKIWFKNRRRKSKVREDTLKEYKKFIENESNIQVGVMNPFWGITNIDINENNVRHTKMPDISTGFDFYKLPNNNNTNSYSNEGSNFSQIMYSSNGFTPPMWGCAISAL